MFDIYIFRLSMSFLNKVENGCTTHSMLLGGFTKVVLRPSTIPALKLTRRGWKKGPKKFH